MKRTAVTLLLLVVSGLVLAEKIYKWVDENGQIHYSSQKPVGQKAETMKVRNQPKVNAQTNESAVESTEAAESTETDADAAAKAQLAKADAASMVRLCEQSRKNLAALNATVRVVQVDEKTGQTVRMNDDQRLQAMKTAQQGIREYCK
ncbi:DUF4124 domain-containing protein [Marinicella litoralis]|uniref:Uncharacterized protein DUF4124 n=1 Tax=Marinicella litoralis TaxID=644220 RepID=A0A4R6XML1_9GAMM|nr:DUF4124 domain-containing protein [Marinicella litoralis]TDR20836.1 uncharacterized protein DUF4124 [Marinicella litoralis]